MARRSRRVAPTAGASNARPVARSAGAPLKLVRRRAPAQPVVASDHPSRWTRPHVRTVAIASGKGGVGKSNLAANLAVTLGARGLRVLLVDADLAQANLDLLLGLHPRFDVQHVLNGEKSLDEVAVEGSRGVTLIPAASGVPGLLELDDYRRECLLRGLGNLERDVDLILIDNASGVSTQVLAFCLAVDDVVVVTTPEMPAFSDAYGLVKLLQQRGITRPVHVVVSHAGSPEESEEATYRLRLVARRFLKLELDSWGSIPFDPTVAHAVRRQEPVVTAFPQSPAALAYQAVAEHLWDEPQPEPAEPSRPLISKLEA